MSTEAWRKKHYSCNVCDKKAIGCLRPDLDIKGLCFCKKHEEEVRLAYIAVCQGTPDVYESMIKDWKHK